MKARQAHRETEARLAEEVQELKREVRPPLSKYFLYVVPRLMFGVLFVPP
jgi:hypothetical protein